MPPQLNFVDDSLPGITRKKLRLGWGYYGPDGKRITDREEIERLNKVGMPPAYEKCWFCADPNGHLQGVGYDARGRKQYRYHPEFRASQDARKYERLADFGRTLPKLRKRIEEDLEGKPTSKEAVLAAVVKLIDSTHMRVGNEEYAKENKSFGATTLRNRHAKVDRGRLKITYKGKHGLKHEVTLTDRRLARIAKRTQELPGQHLFEYVDEDGEVCPVTSSDVNAYIKDASDGDFTAKDFRTWGASVIALENMAKAAEEHGKVKLKTVIEPVAEALGNTPAISRKSYVHPALIEAAKDAGALGERTLPRDTKYLSGHERALIEFLDALPKEEAKLEAEAEAKGKSEAEAAKDTRAQLEASVASA
jgi:DNA topoisomerase I